MSFPNPADNERNLMISGSEVEEGREEGSSWRWRRSRWLLLWLLLGLGRFLKPKVGFPSPQWGGGREGGREGGKEGEREEERNVSVCVRDQDENLGERGK
jgi:hypothetical protein